MDNILMAIIGSIILILGAIGFVIYKIIQINNNSKNLIFNEIDKLSTKVDEINIGNTKLLENSIEKIVEILKKDNESYINSNVNTRDFIESKIRSLNEDITVNLDNVRQQTKSLTSNFEKYSLDNISKIDNYFENMVNLVKNLRLENLINASNSIAKYRNGIIEDKHFIQEVGFAKVVKIIDKKTNEITYVHYDEEGLKEFTETYLDKKLKYSTVYDKSGLLLKGFEYDKESKVIIEYEYDGAGEIDTKIEYEYDETGTKLEKQKIKY